MIPKKKLIYIRNLKKKTKIYKHFKDIKNINNFHLIIFAVKPQISYKVVSQFKSINKNTIIISIMAGKKIKFFEKIIGKSNRVYRIMPNMPVIVNKGMSSIVSNKKSSASVKKNIENLFNNFGKVLWLKKESDIDKVTAISGSGPGYFFLFIEHMLSEALSLGFDKRIIKTLIYQTALGSIILLNKSNFTAKELRKSIAIQGGTTEAAINVFQKNKNLQKLINRALKAAYKKSLELGKNA